jgi:hypothetical protein
MGHNVFAETPCRQRPLQRPACIIEDNIKAYVKDIGCQGYAGFNCAFNWPGMRYNVGIL